jgi:hypothetical protein
VVHACAAAESLTLPAALCLSVAPTDDAAALLRHQARPRRAHLEVSMRRGLVQTEIRLGEYGCVTTEYLQPRTSKIACRFGEMPSTLALHVDFTRNGHGSPTPEPHVVQGGVWLKSGQTCRGRPRKVLSILWRCWRRCCSSRTTARLQDLKAKRARMPRV